ncbi:MAG TPA: hypothetical protein VIZ43_19690 [Trebonia sp.]
MRRLRRRKTVPGLIYPIAVITLTLLKVTGMISWAWWWVLSPLWIGGILLVLGAAFGLLIGLRWYARRM